MWTEFSTKNNFPEFILSFDKHSLNTYFSGRHCSGALDTTKIKIEKKKNPCPHDCILAREIRRNKVIKCATQSQGKLLCVKARHGKGVQYAQAGVDRAQLAVLNWVAWGGLTEKVLGEQRFEEWVWTMCTFGGRGVQVVGVGLRRTEVGWSLPKQRTDVGTFLSDSSSSRKSVWLEQSDLGERSKERKERVVGTAF